MYGKVISGGASMRKGLTKGINEKLEERGEGKARSAQIASAVRDAYKVNTLSSQHTNNISKGGKFTKPSVPSKV